MKKKGFTIVELLAVIIILSIISLIIVPKIGDVIKNARKATARNSVHGYIDAINNKLASNIVNDEVMDGIISVRDLESEIEYRGTRVDGGIVTINNNKIAEAKLCVGGYSFRYYNGEVDNSDTNYCIDKSNIEIAILGAKTTQELSNQFSIDVDLSNSDISSVTNIVCNNNAKPSIVNGELHVDNIYGDTKCSMESSIVTTFSNIDNTVNNIVMIDDETVSRTIDLAENKVAVLYLNGHDITSTTLTDGQHTIRNSGILRIYGADSVIDGTSGAIYNYANSELYVDGGTYNRIHTYSKKAVLKNLTVVCSTDASNCYPLWLDGTGDIEVDNIYASTSGKAFGVHNNQNPTIKVSNSTFNCPNDNCIWLSGGSGMDVTFDNVIVRSTGYSVNNNGSGVVTINSGTYTSENGNAIVNYAGTLNINQTDKPIYLSTYAQKWKPVIANLSTGVLNITADKANACTSNPSDTTSGLCAYALGNGDYTKDTSNGAIMNSYNGEVSGNQAIVNVNGGTYYGGYLGITNQYSGTINIANADVISENVAVRNLRTGTVNITSGTYTGKGNSAITNLASGTVNITQTDKPIYITSLAQAWKPVIANDSTGTINITANQANACTNNVSDTTSGLCVYAEGDKNYTSSTSNGAVRNGAAGTINVNGGTYYGGNQGFNNHAGGTINIRNIIVSSGKYGILNNGSGLINICSTTINNAPEELHINSSSTDGVINYSSDVVFRDGASTPTLISCGGSINAVSTCPISE